MEPSVSPSASIPVGYAEHAPPPDLGSAVVCVWTRLLPDQPDGATHRVLPDGSVDILFGFGRPAERGRDLIDASVVGPMTKPILVQGPQPRLYIGVRFAPGFAHAALGVPASAIVDQRVDYNLLCHDAAPDLDAIAVLSSDEQRMAAVFAVVRRRLARGTTVPPNVRVAVRRIAAAKGNVRIASLASVIGVTRQQLARQFATHVGVTPKLFARVMRTRAALARANAARAAYPRNVSWSAIAQELGYYDQAHFVDEFKALTGLTPGAWIRSRLDR
jgi:AraC-like DNA-binding protein